MLIVAGLLTACQQVADISFECPDIVAGCSLDGLSVSTSTVPQILKPFVLNIEFEDQATTGVYASFAMEGMDMGLNRYKMIKVADGAWQAEVTLPVCVRGRADWLMQIDAKNYLGDRRYLVSFQSD
ncbi:MAG: hypothetical protein U1E13_03435 [Methylophilaceae bacterium]|nr:hypothetical protein [Methylophilaceae bacterium]